jgi:acetyl esterase/lipase
MTDEESNMLRNSFLRAMICTFAMSTIAPFARADADQVVAGADGKDLIDLYVPASRNFATIVYTYGGGWHSGSGKSSAPIAEKLKKAGIACALVTHRLAPEHPFPAQAQDVASAFAWVHEHIAEQGGDPQRIFLVGHSSGAHLSLLIAADPKYLAAHHMSPSAIAGVIGLSTPTDLEPRDDGKGFGNTLMAGHGADPFGRDAKVMKDASPIQHVSKDLPHALLLVGDHDFPMFAGDAATFAAAAKKAGAKVQTEVIKDRDHLGMVRKLVEENDSVFRKLIAFVTFAP